MHLYHKPVLAICVRIAVSNYGQRYYTPSYSDSSYSIFNMYIYQSILSIYMSKRLARISGRFTADGGKRPGCWKCCCMNAHPKLHRASSISSIRGLLTRMANERTRYPTRKWIETRHTTARHLFYPTDARAAYYNWLCVTPRSFRRHVATIQLSKRMIY